MALKEMADEGAFRRELDARLDERGEARFDKRRGLPIIRIHEETAADGRPIRCIVMPRADCDLDGFVRSEPFAGEDHPGVTQVVRQLALALKEMHDRGFVHAGRALAG